MLLEACITDLRSCKAIIKVLKQQDPEIRTVYLPIDTLRAIRREVQLQYEEQCDRDNMISDPNFAIRNILIYGVQLGLSP